jgi:hypothetical protein
MSAPVTATSMVTAVPPAPVPTPVAAIPITISALHPIAIAIIPLSGSAGECQTPNTENQQQTKNYYSL